MIRCPGNPELGVTSIELLRVPVLSKGGDDGVTTAGSNVTWRSYEMTPRPVTAPVVIGTVTTPWNGLTFGSETGTPVKEA
jgi:hypothetical protein